VESIQISFALLPLISSLPKVILLPWKEGLLSQQSHSIHYFNMAAMVHTSMKKSSTYTSGKQTPPVTRSRTPQPINTLMYPRNALVHVLQERCYYTQYWWSHKEQNNNFPIGTTRMNKMWENCTVTPSKRRPAETMSSDGQKKI
jgi:hypothetical protein